MLLIMNVEKSGHYDTTCMSLSKCNNKKDEDSYKTNGNYTKVHRAYITWEDKNESSSSSSYSLNEGLRVVVEFPHIVAHSRVEF